VNNIINLISINPQRGITLAHQVKQQIIWLMASGKIKPGDRLPSVRRLAEHLTINLHTVRNAYAMLEGEELVETRQGWGTKALSLDPLRIAQSQVAIRSHTIGVILPALINPLYHEFLQGIQEVADADQSMIFVCNTQGEPSEAWRYVNQLVSKQVDGIIVTSQDIEQFIPGESDSPIHEFIGVPFVSVDWPDATSYSVKIDLEGAGYQATKHLIQHGHQRIGLITYGHDPDDFRLEDLGYQRALEEAGIQNDPSLVAVVQDFEAEAGKQGATMLLKLPQPPSAIFAITDLMAWGVMQVVKAAGLSIPDDIALVSFNDIPLAAMLDPPLTSVSLPGYRMGMEAMKLLNCLIHRKQPKRRQIILPTELITRQSCGCKH
jgi:DNA-binding LacI/PurR family transcriptional regulator